VQPAIGGSVGLTLLTETDSLASSLCIMLANLASVVMKSSIEWRPLFEEIGFAVLNSSLVSFHCRFFQLGLHIFSTLHIHLFSRTFLHKWFQEESYFDNLDHHRKFRIVTISLLHDEALDKKVFETFEIFSKWFVGFLLYCVMFFLIRAVLWVG